MGHAAISLGSSLGDRIGLIEQAIGAIDKLKQTRVLAASSLYETPPVGGKAQNKFINACVLLDTMLSPLILITALQKIEHQMGRNRQERWADRRIDLDLLLYDELVIRDQNCILPHPEMTQRAFVLLPLAEIAPHMKHPVTGQTIAELANALPRAEVDSIKRFSQKSSESVPRR